MSEEELNVEELMKKYREARKVRRKYAIKQFFKIKRGAFGFFIIVSFAILSVLSSIIASNPDEFRHAPLSRPAWLKWTDPNTLREDFVWYESSFETPDAIASNYTNISEVEPGKVYATYNLTPIKSFRYGGLYHYDEGCNTTGSASLVIYDDTSIELSSEDVMNQTVIVENNETVNKTVIYNVTYALNLKIEWKEDVPPYIVYLRFAHKLEICMPTIYTYQATIGRSGSISKKFSLGPGISIPARLNISILNPEPGKEISVELSSGDLLITETTTDYIYIKNLTLQGSLTYTIRNIGTRDLDVNITIWTNFPPEIIYPTKIDFMVNLWNKTANREMTREELKNYLEKFGVIPPEDELTQLGLIVHKDLSKASDWVEMGKITRLSLLARKIYYKPFFQQGNIIIIKLVASTKIQPTPRFLQTRNHFTRTVKFKWSIDDINLEAQGKYYGIMGTDDLGRDIAYMIIDGLKISLLVGFVATMANIAIGVTLGLVSGYVGGKTDEIIMRICDFFMSIPGFPLLIVLAFIFYTINMDPLISIIIVLSIFGWAGMARTIRSQVLALRASTYVEAAKASGASSFYIIRKHILPGVWPLVLMYLMVGVVGNILAEASLSFLGVLRPTWHSLGKMIQEASGLTAATGGGGGGLSMDRFHWLFFPGLFLMLIGYAFYAIGDAYDELINPKRRKMF